jgi:excisionase family DNA binding protein
MDIWEPLTVTVEDAMRLSSLGRSFLYDCLGDGRIASVKRGKRRLIVYQSLKQFLTMQDATEKEPSCSNFA